MIGHAAALAAAHGQGWRQVGELLLAFVLASVIGVERQIRGKSAGMRTQAIVGTAAALIVLVSKYGFGDVLAPGHVVLDPSRVAAQIVSGIGFLGAGLIIMRGGAVRGLTTAAAVWETAAIGMAAGAGLPLLAVVVTALHYVIVLAFTPLARLLPGGDNAARFQVSYLDGQGVLRRFLTECSKQGWTLDSLSIDHRGGHGVLADLVTPLPAGKDVVALTVLLAGRGVAGAANALGGIDGVLAIDRLDDDRE